MALIGWSEYSQPLLFIAEKSLNELQDIFLGRVRRCVCKFYVTFITETEVRFHLLLGFS